MQLHLRFCYAKYSKESAHYALIPEILKGRPQNVATCCSAGTAGLMEMAFRIGPTPR